MTHLRSGLPLFTTGVILLAVAAFAQPEKTEDSPALSPSTIETAPPVPAEPASPPPVAAPSPQTSPPTSTSRAPTQELTLISTSGIVGTAVKNSQGESIGEIRELMLDQHSGRIVYVLVTCSEMFGMKQKTLAIPWDTLKLELNQGNVAVELRNDQLYPPASTTLSQRQTSPGD
jgi:sporulation protein YlmC with PRC-barrel domain